MNWLRRFANQPTKHWAEFKLGLGIFALAALLILAGARYWMWLQIPGVVLLALAVLIAGRAYLGLLLYRLTSHMPRPKPPGDGADKDK